MVDFAEIKNRFQGRKIYTYWETLKTISSQSSTASYILTDMLLAGYIEKTKEGYRINQ